ncbi:MAG: transcriptional repressor [Schleiferiaceae bacterium]|nr:transcriptional repressor [Schleiferiaceae bacterium]
MEITSAEQILASHGIRKTSVRLLVLHLLQKADEALPKRDLEEQMEEGVDRVTLYRTIKTFEDKGIIHGVPDFDGQLRYALCKGPCTTHKHHDSHVHFQCAKCGKTKCLEDTPVPRFALASELQVETVQVVARGICESCK